MLLLHSTAGRLKMAELNGTTSVYRIEASIRSETLRVSLNLRNNLGVTMTRMTDDEINDLRRQ